MARVRATLALAFVGLVVAFALAPNPTPARAQSPAAPNNFTLGLNALPPTNPIVPMAQRTIMATLRWNPPPGYAGAHTVERAVQPWGATGPKTWATVTTVTEAEFRDSFTSAEHLDMQRCYRVRTAAAPGGSPSPPTSEACTFIQPPPTDSSPANV
ncbi:MAG: hypothetical protein HS107_04530 [Thermoflexaceae bacterium]|nr:hypothetical protein [Thermoflexaceae bacterium]